MDVLYWQWILIIASGLLFFFVATSKTTDQFFKAITNSKAPNGLVLTGSLIISDFAKSITNAANLGLEFGILGGSYAGYYLSFAVWNFNLLRTKGILPVFMSFNNQIW
jgi:hypothetical protein